MIYTREPSDPDDPVFVRCTVCGFNIRVDRTPRGGKYTPAATTETIEGTSVTVATNNGQGCPFCCSPWWDGGEPGDLTRGWSR